MGEFAALSASSVWAMASLIFSRLGRVMTALALNWLKCLLALLLMWVALFLLEGRFWPEALSWGETGALAVSGLVGLTLGDTLFFQALQRLGARRTLLLSAMAPPMTAVMAVPVLGEPIGVGLVVGMGLTLGGVVWVILERHGGGEDLGMAGADGRMTAEMRAGIGLAIGAAFCQAVGNVLTKWGGAEISALEISIVRLVFGVMGLTILMGVLGQFLMTMKVLQEPKRLGLLFVATFLGSFMGIWLMNAGLRYTDVGVASTLSSTSPIFVLPLAYFFDGERLTIRSILGALVAVLGVAVLFLW